MKKRIIVYSVLAMTITAILILADDATKLTRPKPKLIMWDEPLSVKLCGYADMGLEHVKLHKTPNGEIYATITGTNQSATQRLNLRLVINLFDDTMEICQAITGMACWTPPKSQFDHHWASTSLPGRGDPLYYTCMVFAEEA